MLDRFWKEFKQRVDHVDGTVTRGRAGRELGKDPTTRKPISVRYGKYGPFVQMGTKDDEEKPKFASLRPHQRMDAITLPEALELFNCRARSGTCRTVTRSASRSAASVRTCSKLEIVSIKDDDPYKVELPRALELIRAKEELDANRIILDFPTRASRC